MTQTNERRITQTAVGVTVQSLLWPACRKIHEGKSECACERRASLGWKLRGNASLKHTVGPRPGRASLCSVHHGTCVMTSIRTVTNQIEKERKNRVTVFLFYCSVRQLSTQGADTPRRMHPQVYN